MKKGKKVDRVTLRIDRNAMDQVRRLVRKEDYSSASEVIQDAVSELLATRFAPDNIERRTVEIPKRSINCLQQIVDAGEAVSIEDAVRDAVRKYVRLYEEENNKYKGQPNGQAKTE